jgi:hypothetical protein
MNIAEYTKSRGYIAKPILNTQAAAEGKPLQVMGYELRGPRANKTIVVGDDLFAARLWCDGVDYANRKIAERKCVTGHEWVAGSPTRCRRCGSVQ